MSESVGRMILRCDRLEECKERDENLKAEIEELKGRLDDLWKTVREMEAEHVKDMKEATRALHSLELTLKDTTSKLAGIVVALGGVMTVISLIAQFIFHK